jgi:predicted RNase H-like nuclease (RuvC/YqgF family)
MSIDLTKTVRILRKPKVALDERGHNVWVDEVETAEFELVSTMMLQAIIESGDDAQKQQLREAADSGDGVLTHDPDKNRFEIVDDEDLMAALQQADDSAPPAVGVQVETTVEQDDQFELVSTQMLRAMLDPDAKNEDPPEDDTAFDPYNSN